MNSHLKLLLLDPENRGLPTEYLLARVRGRRSHLISDWKRVVFGLSPSGEPFPAGAGIASPEADWKGLSKEFGWIYRQMNERLRDIFRPFFFYSELRTVFVCLRHITNEHRKAGVVDETLSLSLLSEKAKKVMRNAGDLNSAVSGLEKLLIPVSELFSGLSNTETAEGTREIESELAKRSLISFAQASLHPVMKSFFKRIIDSRNIMILYKCIRLDKKALPDFIPGGNVSPCKFEETARRKNVGQTGLLVQQVTGIRIDDPDPSVVETSLYRAMSKYLRKEAREPLGMGLILEYLWRCEREAMNMNIVFYGKGLERETVMSEIVP